MKTITLDEDAYARLKAWKKGSRESFSSVVKRVIPEPGTLGAFLNHVSAEVGAGDEMRDEVMERTVNDRPSIKEDPMELIADTTFLVGLWRKQAWATSFARRNASKSLGIPWVVLGEFWNGAVRAGHDPERVAEFLDIGNPIMEPGPVIAVYARLCAELQASGIYSKTGQNDLWIGAVAISRNLPLVSRNHRHFAEFPRLRLEVAE